MKHLSIPLFAFVFASASYALPRHWDVDLAAQSPQVYTLQRPRGETYELEAVLKDNGKPFAPAITNAFIFWQTNGMENLYWSEPASVSNNVLRATWLPSMDPGASTVRGYIGDPGHIYAAAFQFRFIASPGELPNELPLPQPVIDFAKVTVLNPPWSGGGGGGVDTNAVELIANMAVETNAVTVGLSSSVSNRYTKAETDAKFAEKRYKADRAVYSVIRTENTDWTTTLSGELADEFLTDIGGLQNLEPPSHDESRWFFAPDRIGGWECGLPEDSGTPISSTNVATFVA